MVRGLSWRRRAARAVLWAEAAARAFWAPAALLASLLAACLTGLPGSLPAVPHGLFLVAGVLGLGWLTRQGLRRLEHPDQAQADRRLERDSGLPHRPLQVLEDRPAGAAESLLWQAHRARALSALGKLRLRGPSPGLAARDPYALRIGAMLLLASGVVVAGPQAGLLFGRSFGFSLGPAGPAPVLQAWIEPPAYTGLAPIFLTPDHRDVDVPDGSKLTVSLTGGYFTPHLAIAGHGAPFRALGPASWQAVSLLHHSGQLRIIRFFHTAGLWKLGILPNTPPSIAWNTAPGQADKSLETRLPWKVAQRWGVAALHAELRPAGQPKLPSITIPIPLPGTPRAASGVAIADLEANPYAGVEMEAELAGRDVSGQAGASAVEKFVLPARVFHDGLARAIADVRRRLALHPHARGEAADDIDALTGAPGQRARHAGIVVNLAAAAALLRDDGSDAGLAEAQDRLWTAALALDGALPDEGEKALAQAREDMRRALDERQRGKIGDSELARKMAELRRAVGQRLAEIARHALQKGQLKPVDPHLQKYSSPLLDHLMKQLEQALREGRMEDAKRRLAELEKTLDKLKSARVLSPEEARQAAQARRQAKQATGAAQDLVQREGQLMDHVQARAPLTPKMPPRPSMWGQDAPPPPDPDQLEANRDGQLQDRRVEGAMSRALDALKQGFAASGGKVPKNLDDASHDMQQAQEALQAGDDPAARAAEGKAVSDLQKGGRDMARQMQQNSELAIAPGGRDQGEEMGADEDGQGDEPGGDQSADGKRDPLGRQVGGTGGRATDDGSVHVPTAIEEGRSRAIQEELRRRGADRERPPRELDYIDRLLKPFSD
jgi:uncharacterized protein (TIGR02302 family)